jgi:GNAT superfamily N-acetyltransferase
LQNIAIRKATRRDSRVFLSLLVKLAEFEHLDPPDAAARHRILEDVFAKKKAKLLLTFVGKVPVGYAFYFYTYSTFLAKPTLYLEDIFVLEKFRKKGLGSKLFLSCVEEAAKNQCGRLEFSVLTWNKNAIRFYEKLGAKRLKEWYSYRLTQETIKQLAETRTTVQNLRRKSQLA